MDYTTFKAAIGASVRNKLGEEVKVTFQRIPKNNGVFREGVAIVGDNVNMVPVIYLEPYYQAFEDGATVEELGGLMVSEWKEKCTDSTASMEDFADFRKMRPHIYYQLINFEKNRELLAKVPYRQILDLALVYYYRTEHLFCHSGRILIHNEHMKHWEAEENDIYAAAAENTQRNLPHQFMSIGEVIAGIAKDEEITDLAEEHRNDEGMYVLTNAEKYLGASCILYPKVLEQIADMLRGDFFVLPSSIHECIIVPGSGEDLSEELEGLVREVNQMYVEPEEYLSDHAYHYSRAGRSLRLGDEHYKYFTTC